jgi:hypothetical protein
MKKWTSFALIGIFLLSLLCAASCNTMPADSPVQSTVEITVEETSPEVAIAMQLYEAALKGEIRVIDECLGEIYLGDCQFLSDNMRLDECDFLSKVILDMDGDGINEYVIQSKEKDHIILRYYDGNVYSYCFESKDFYNLNTDGSFYWSDSQELENWCHGLNQITFDGSTLQIKEIYRIKHMRPFDIYEELEFYVDGKQITRKEFLQDYTYRDAMMFTPLDLSCEYPISSEKAYELASRYWDLPNGMTDGAVGTLYLYRVVILEKPNGDAPIYRIGLQVEQYHNHVPDSWYSLPTYSVRIYEELFVDAITGECWENLTPAS